jgi:hypothetical protein
MPSRREKELEAIVRQCVPAIRDVLWCALVWNDHNFNHKDLLDKAERAAKALGWDRARIRDPVGVVNEYLEHVDRVLESSSPPTSASQKDG